MPNSLIKILVITLIALYLPASAFAQTEHQIEPNTSQDIQNIPVALEGYDVLTYFLPSGPEKGSYQYQVSYRDKRYLFLSAENQKSFAANPERYLPEFDAYCACATSENKRVIADPSVFKITQGKLVLFENTQALSKWNKNEEERYTNAQKFWKYENEYTANDRLKEDTRVRLFEF